VSLATHSSAAMPERSSGDYSLYLLQCGDGSLYTGIARDVDARLREHRDGRRGARYLRGRGPLVLVFHRSVGDRSRAQRLEYRVRKLRRPGKLALIDGKLRLEDLDV
jgi:putative endonuclease